MKRGFRGSAIARAGSVVAAFTAVGCTTVTTTQRAQVEPLPVNAAIALQNPRYGEQRPGVVDFIWEEPMVDVVEVPPGLDPEGIYYRPAHHAVVEVRQGRWRYYKPGTGRSPEAAPPRAQPRAFSEGSGLAEFGEETGAPLQEQEIAPPAGGDLAPQGSEGSAAGTGTE